MAISIQNCKHGHKKLNVILGRDILAGLRVAVRGHLTVEVDRIVGQLRITAGEQWLVYQWGTAGNGQIALTALLLGIPEVAHQIEAVKHAWDQEGRLLIVLPTWAKPVPKVNGRAA